MASLYPRKGRTGFTITWKVNGRKFSKTVRSKANALKFKAKVEQLEEAARLGIGEPDAAAWMLADAEPIAKHVEAFRKYLLHKGDTPKHAGETASLITRIFALAVVERISDITPSRVRAGIDEFRKAKQRGKGTRSLRRCNAALTACKTFSRWLRMDKRAREHVLEDMEGFNEGTDKRLVRRALSEEECIKLYEATEVQRVRLGLAGPDRAMLYRVAIGTGFRLKELLSLKPDSFVLGHRDEPHVTLAGASAKNRRAVEQLIQPWLADLLRPYLVDRDPAAPVFPILPCSRPNKAIRADCKAAGIDPTGIDFHALRHTGITHVCRGAGIRIAQAWARHSTPALTARYAHVELVDERRALDALPKPKRDEGDGKKRRQA
jgi:integrase